MNYDIVIPKKKKKKTTIILLYTYIFVYLLCLLKINISYLFYENYNMKNTFFKLI